MKKNIILWDIENIGIGHWFDLQYQLNDIFYNSSFEIFLFVNEKCTFKSNIEIFVNFYLKKYFDNIYFQIVEKKTDEADNHFIKTVKQKTTLNFNYDFYLITKDKGLINKISEIIYMFNLNKQGIKSNLLIPNLKLFEKSFIDLIEKEKIKSDFLYFSEKEIEKYNQIDNGFDIFLKDFLEKDINNERKFLEKLPILTKESEENVIFDISRGFSNDTIDELLYDFIEKEKRMFDVSSKIYLYLNVKMMKKYLKTKNKKYKDKKYKFCKEIENKIPILFEEFKSDVYCNIIFDFINIETIEQKKDFKEKYKYQLFYPSNNENIVSVQVVNLYEFLNMPKGDFDYYFTNKVKIDNYPNEIYYNFYFEDNIIEIYILEHKTNTKIRNIYKISDIREGIFDGIETFMDSIV